MNIHTQNSNFPNGLSIPLRETPEWCPTTRVLKIAGKVVKHFKWPAPNQEMLITAFAELNWPDQIDDPLPQTNVCPKRKLHDTIKCLNRNQIHPLIKFRGDGTGLAARWEFRPPEEEKPEQTLAEPTETPAENEQKPAPQSLAPLHDTQPHFGQSNEETSNN